MPLLGLLTIIIGIIYGYTKPGKEDRSGMLEKGILIGVILGIISITLGAFIGTEFLLMSNITGSIVFVDILLITALFVVGMYIGNWLEEKAKRSDDRDDRSQE